MTVKELKQVMNIPTNVTLHIAENEEDARNEKSIGMYTFNYGTNLSNCYSRLKVIYIWVTGVNELDVWACENKEE